MEQNDSHMLPTFAVESLALLAWMGSYLMNADVEKAVERMVASIYDHDCQTYRDTKLIEQALRDQDAEIARLRDRLREEESNATELAKRLTRQREMDENSIALLRFLLDRFGSYMDESDKRAITAHLGSEHE